MSAAKPIEILLVGLGAVGSIYARVLEASGRARVTAVARSNYELYQAGNVTLQTEKWGTFESWKPHRLVKSQAEALAGDVHYDYCFLTTKALPDITPTAKVLSDAIESKKVGAWAILQNGVGVEDGLYEAVKHLGTPLISCVAWIGANPSPDGKTVIQRGAWEVVCAGNYPPPGRRTEGTVSDRERDALNTFVGLLKDGGGTVHTSDEIDAVRYSKNMVNCTWASFQTLARSVPVAWAELDDAITQPLKDAIKEVVDVGFASGLLYDQLIQYPMGTPLGSKDGVPGLVWGALIKMSIESSKKPGGGHRMSMWVDADSGRPIEVEAIVGSVVRIARQHNMTTPRLDLIYALLKGLQVSLVQQQQKRE